MAITGISMDDMLARLQAARAAVAATPLATPAKADNGSAKVDFAAMLKSTLDSVNQTQQHADALGRQFQLGNPKVSLEETMIAAQEATITLQAAVQVRNKVIAAYNDIMNMQV